MTDKAIPRCTLRGSVIAPPSKSISHRLLIASALAEGESVVRGVDFSQDILATMDCLRLLGAEIRIGGENVYVHGADVRKAHPVQPLPCRDSASTLRFLIPIGWLCGQDVCFTGSERLLNRPLDVYEELALRRGMGFVRNEKSVRVRGPLERGYLEVRGDVSSQFISGLLFSLPLIPGPGWGSRLRITGKMESRSYIDMTISVLETFGVRWIWEDDRTLISRCSQRYQPRDVQVEGDHSNAAFFLAANALGHEIRMDGLNKDSLQGDRAAQRHLDALKQGQAVIDLADCPDLGPVLMMAAAALHGGVFLNTRRLRIKESDRAQCMAEELIKCGAQITVEDNRVLVHKAPLHSPCAPVCGHGDHRIVMAMSILLTRLGGTITGADAVNKSYPGFFDALEGLAAD